MDVKTRKKRTIISIILFIVCFAGLLAVATFADLKINDILTSSSLAEHTYLTNDTFGAAFESFGDSPIYLMLGFAFSLIFVFIQRNKSGAFQIILCIAAFAAVFASAFVWLNSVLDYIIEHLSMYQLELHEGAYLKVIVAFVAAIVSFLAVMATNNFSDDNVNKLLRFSIATVLVCALPTIIVNLGVKGYVGRIRYRAMNMYPENETYGFAAFARWFEHHGQWISKDEMKQLFGTTDALKSFPSGHTAAAGCTYALIMLIDALGIKNKGAKAALWLCPIVFTGTVAVSRMVCGAHFMSDVLVGGTLTFVTMIICREFIVNGRQNLKSLGSK